VSRLKLVLQGLTVAVVLGLLALLVWKVTHEDDAAKVGDAAPAFHLSRLDAPGKLALASYRGKVVVLNFWASWCAPCKQEAPRLEAAWKRYRQQGVVVVGVDAQDFSGDAKRFIRKHGLTYPNVHDGPGSTLGRYGVSGFPETYFVDRHGRLVGEKVTGEVSDEKLTDGIRRALAA
jgi:cytochrome c biogenesis protein CcmG, thiol:disulfide interchange protein DsbE